MNNTQCGFSGQWAGPGITLPIDFAPARGRNGAEVTVTSCDGHAFVVRRSGHGAPVFLLHDMAETQGAWDAVRGTLSWSNTVCTWDARGHGTSRGTPESAVPTLDLLAADLDAAVTACAPEGAVLVGHGLGALTVLEYLRNYGDERVSGAVLVDQSPRMLTMPDWSLGLFGGFPAGDEMGFESRIRADFAGAWSALQARAAAAAVHAERRHTFTARRIAPGLGRTCRRLDAGALAQHDGSRLSRRPRCVEVAAAGRARRRQSLRHRAVGALVPRGRAIRKGRSLPESRPCAARRRARALRSRCGGVRRAPGGGDAGSGGAHDLRGWQCVRGRCPCSRIVER